MTIVEIMVVIIILSLLATLVAPAVVHIREQARRGASLVAVALLDGACLAYHADHDEYPASSGPAGWFGCQMLPVYLIGYRDDDGNDGVPGDFFDAATPDDGQDGFGFRLVFRGTVYGPYNGAEKADLSATPPYYFLDAFDQPILYYRYDDVGDTYDLADNDMPAVANPANPDGQGAASLGMAYFQNAGGAWYRNDFALCSAGPDGVFSDAADTDDVTNFLEED